MKTLHFLQHVPFEGLGSIEPWVESAGFSIAPIRLFRDDPLPKPQDVQLLIVMGGPMNIYEHERYPWLIGEKRFIGQVIDAGNRVLGICLGAQLIADVLGARVFRNRHPEIGWFSVQKCDAAGDVPLSNAFPASFEAFHWHGDTFDIPKGAVHLARSEACDNQGFVFNDTVVGLQFHLETTRKSASDLIRHCGDELVDGPFIQTADTILANDDRFKTANRLMVRLLGSFTK